MSARFAAFPIPPSRRGSVLRLPRARAKADPSRVALRTGQRKGRRDAARLPRLPATGPQPVKDLRGRTSDSPASIRRRNKEKSF